VTRDAVSSRPNVDAPAVIAYVGGPMRLLGLWPGVLAISRFDTAGSPFARALRIGHTPGSTMWDDRVCLSRGVQVKREAIPSILETALRRRRRQGKRSRSRNRRGTRRRRKGNPRLNKPIANGAAPRPSREKVTTVVPKCPNGKKFFSSTPESYNGHRARAG